MNTTSALFFTHKQRGQSLVEFGLMVMILMILLSGAVNFGLAFFSYVAIRDAAQEGALYGSINPTGDITNRVLKSAADSPVVTASTVSIHPDGTAKQYCAGHQLMVKVEYDYDLTVPLISIINPIHLTASATSVILKNPDATYTENICEAP